MIERRNAKYKDKLTMDLHGLQVEGAMELFKERLEYWDKKKDKKKGEPIHLIVITGAGNHSDEHGAKIKPTVLNYLRENKREFTELNNGSVQITL
jgi:DNA-nicking Smr family endonuclease